MVKNGALCKHQTTLVGVMKMGNIMPRGGIEPTFLASQAIGVTNTPLMLPDVTILPVPICPCGPLPERSVQITTLWNTFIM